MTLSFEQMEASVPQKFDDFEFRTNEGVPALSTALEKR